jgi:2-polyprenyl-3-methyl-5-hydroxy-6-metoxy-1,4-benzoquinol methylase
MDYNNKKFNYDKYYLNCLENDWSRVSFPIISALLEQSLKHIEAGNQLGNVLDFGCGNGIYSKILKRHAQNIYGVDISEYAVTKCKEEGIYDSVIKLENNSSLPFHEKFFELIFSTEVIEHIENLELVFSRFNQILKEKGILVITTTMYFNSIFSYRREKNDHSYFQMVKVIWNYFQGFINKNKQKEFILKYCFTELGGHYHGFHYWQLKRILKSNGFKICYNKYFYPTNPFPFPFKWESFKLALGKKFPKNLIIPLLYVLIKLTNKTLKHFNVGTNNIFIIAQKMQ